MVEFYITITQKFSKPITIIVADLLSGVVQGSGIGPVTFLIYIDELAKLLENIGVSAKLFADDVKVYVNAH